MKLADLKPAPYNPRKISKDALAGLSASLHEFGDISGIVWNKRTGNLVAGHQRLDALKTEHGEALSLKQRNGGLLLITPTDTFPVRVVDWPEPQEQAANIAANNPHIAGEFKQDALDKIIADLGQTDYASLLKPLRIDELLSPKQVHEDEVPEPPKEPITKPGDLWTLGEHRVLCGDATKVEDVGRSLNGESVTFIFADPPYGMGLNTDWSGAKSSLQMLRDKGLRGGNKYDPVRGDDEAFDPQFLLATVSAIDVFLWGADYYAERLSEKNEGSWFVWDKRLDESSDRMYGSCFELCWSRRRHRRQIIRIKWAGVFGVEQEPDKRRWHPTQKPVALAAWFVNGFSQPGQLIYDPFLGSGTTLIAAEQLGRRCYGIEIEPKYVDVTVKRWEQLTGRKAERE